MLTTLLCAFCVMAYFSSVVSAQGQCNVGFALTVTENPPLSELYGWVTTVDYTLTPPYGTLQAQSGSQDGTSWDAWTDFGSPVPQNGSIDDRLVGVMTNPAAFQSAAVPLMDVFVGASDGNVYALFQKDDTGVFYDWIQVNTSLYSHAPFSPDAVQALSTANGTYVFALVDRDFTSSNDLQMQIYWSRCQHRVCTGWELLGGDTFTRSMSGASFSVVANPAMGDRIEIFYSSEGQVLQISQVGVFAFEDTWTPVIDSTEDWYLQPYNAPSVYVDSGENTVYFYLTTLQSNTVIVAQEICNSRTCKWSSPVDVGELPGSANEALAQPFQFARQSDATKIIFTTDATGTVYTSQFDGDQALVWTAVTGVDTDSSCVTPTLFALEHKPLFVYTLDNSTQTVQQADTAI